MSEDAGTDDHLDQVEPEPGAGRGPRTARPSTVVLTVVIVGGLVAAGVALVVTRRSPPRIAGARVTAITTEGGAVCVTADDRPWVSSSPIVPAHSPQVTVPGTFDQTGDLDGTFSWDGASTPVHTKVEGDDPWKGMVVCALR